ncbi:MAG: hypothetical protein Unbinned2365contig1001_26 [Prokaryotic dsDNA virus sp.]|nr:MAG: hypothetical protein Unbinned2365contig1001_26 [Prokaryotic dsDNA virus sp.]|tara:strand:- start:23183 stop:23431 length:249 start_codon:yes stop_codon:yes gene_type:complete
MKINEIAKEYDIDRYPENIKSALKNKFSNSPCFTYLELINIHDALLVYLGTIEEGLYLWNKVENLAYLIDFCLENKLYNEKE